MEDFRPSSILSVTSRVVENHGGTCSSQISNISQAPKKNKESPELVLAPSFIRMVVTLGAVQPTAQEDSNFLGHHVLRTTQVRTTIPMATRAVISLPRNSLPGHLIVWLVGGDVVPYPLPIHLGKGGGTLFKRDSEK